MSHMRFMVVIGLLFAFPIASSAATEQVTKGNDEAIAREKKDQGAAADKNIAKPSMEKPVYKPPLRGSPAGRVGGGTRGTSDRESFSLLVLAPDHVGLTIYDQPSLYWFISKPTSFPVELTIIERNAVKPLLEKVVNGIDQGGIHVIRLSDYGVRLAQDVPYKWFVTLVTDAAHRSKDILAGGIIRRVDAPPAVAARLEGADRNGAFYVYSEEGYWYDALGAISGMIEASPDNVDLRKQRAGLLEQVGLAEAADFEKNR
jgi:hypothetical protein